MKEHEARLLLPGAGDLQEKLNEIHSEHGAPECEDFTVKQSEGLLDWIVDWLMTADDDEDEDEDEDESEYENEEPEHRESDSDNN